MDDGGGGDSGNSDSTTTSTATSSAATTQTTQTTTEATTETTPEATADKAAEDARERVAKPDDTRVAKSDDIIIVGTAADSAKPAKSQSTAPKPAEAAPKKRGSFRSEVKKPFKERHNIPGYVLMYFIISGVVANLALLIRGIVWCFYG